MAGGMQPDQLIPLDLSGPVIGKPRTPLSGKIVNFNSETPEWKLKVEFFRARRDDLLKELAAYPTNRNRTNFLRGRIFELSELIDLKME